MYGGRIAMYVPSIGHPSYSTVVIIFPPSITTQPWSMYMYMYIHVAVFISLLAVPKVTLLVMTIVSN